MKAIILAAGEGVRMRPLTNETPKPMLRVSGKPILEHILSSLPDKVNRVVLVVGYLHQQIHGHFGHHFGRIKIDYVVQSEKLGTYHALELCKDLLDNEDKFIVTYADDLHGAENFKKCSESDSCAILTLEADDPGKFGVVEVDSEGVVVGIEEKPENPKTNLVSTGVLVLDKSIFNYPARQHPNGEYYLTDSIAQMIQAGHKFQAVMSNFWLPIGYPEDLIKAETALKN
ncbi:MAG: nucleotidyltransferase family protein [Candidatus Taylorbacteria bacterium]|nr:nucleotidyltransferase family protein [Candidatus Taylorbacteria bacterium]